MNQIDQRCRYLSFSRNFGKRSSYLCGVKKFGGRLCSDHGCGSSGSPDMLPEMYRILTEEDYDNVATKRSTRDGEPKIRSFLSELFYKFVNRISKTEIVSGASDFRLMSRKMVDAVLEMSEYNRFSKGIFEWVGFRTKWLEFKMSSAVPGRQSGQCANCFSIHWKELPVFRWLRFPSHRLLVFYFSCFPLR